MILGRHVLKLVLALLAAATLFTTLQRIASVSRDLGSDPREGPPRPPRAPRADVAAIVAVEPDDPQPARAARADEPVAERPDDDGPDPEGEIPLVDPDDDDPYADLHRRG